MKERVSGFTAEDAEGAEKDKKKYPQISGITQIIVLWT